MSPVPILAALLVVAVLALAAVATLWRRARRRQDFLSLHLKASNAQYRQVAASADLCLAVLDNAGLVVDWNPALEKIYGCPRAEALGQPFFRRFVPLPEAATLASRAAALKASDDVFEFSFAVPQRDDPVPCQLRWRARHFTDARDGSRYLSLIGHDVTALEALLEQLAESEGRFRQMFESVPVALALIDLEGRLRMVNSECARFFGFEAPEQMVALNIRELVPHDADRRAGTLALAALRSRTERQYQLESRYRRRDGSLRWGHARVVLLEVAPGQTFFLAKLSDVHERKQTEQALMESERRLATLIGNLSGAVYRYLLPPGSHLLHHDCVPEFLSEGVEHLTGQNRQVFTQGESTQSLGRLIVAADRPRLLAALMAAMAGDGRFEASYRLRHAAGGERWVTEHGLVWQRPDGSWSVDGHFTDISREREARESEQVYRRLLGDADASYVSLSPGGRVIEVNEPFCRLFGLPPPDQLLGHALQPLLAPGYVGELELFLDRVLAEGSARDVEFSYRRPDGEHRNFLTTAIAMQEGGQPVVKCLLLDISRIRQAERARREADIRYRSLFNTNVNGICFLNLEGVIEAANPALCRLLGVAEADLRGRGLRDFTPAEWHQADAQAEAQLLSCGSCDAYGKTLRGSDGSEVPVSLQSWLVRDEDDMPQRILCLVSDLRESPAEGQPVAAREPSPL